MVESPGSVFVLSPSKFRWYWRLIPLLPVCALLVCRLACWSQAEGRQAFLAQ